MSKAIWIYLLITILFITPAIADLDVVSDNTKIVTDSYDINSNFNINSLSVDASTPRLSKIGEYPEVEAIQDGISRNVFVKDNFAYVADDGQPPNSFG